MDLLKKMIGKKEKVSAVTPVENTKEVLPRSKSYPRVYCSDQAKKRLTRIAKKQNITVKKLADKVINAGCKALGY